MLLLIIIGAKKRTGDVSDFRPCNTFDGVSLKMNQPCLPKFTCEKFVVEQSTFHFAYYSIQTNTILNLFECGVQELLTRTTQEALKEQGESQLE